MDLELTENYKNLLTRDLLTIMGNKRTNICLSADYDTSEEVLNVAEELGPHICVLKTHVDTLDNFSFDFVRQLKELSRKHNFLIMEDRKFSDIGNTVMKQYTKGYRIHDWADLVTAHVFSGPECIESLRRGKTLSMRGCLPVAQMSCEGNLCDEKTVHMALSLAERFGEDFINGFISQSRISPRPDLIHFTPGVHIEYKGDSHGQRYVTPETAILERGADIIIVGRGITRATNRLETAKHYKERAFASLCKRNETSLH